MRTRASSVAVLGLLAAAGLAAQQPVFRAGTDLVHLVVTVTDRRGALVADLTPGDFEVLEDGRPQTIEYFARGDGGEAVAGPLHLGLLLDTSGSMQADIEDARTAAIRFLNTFLEARDMTLVEFDADVRVSRFDPADFPRLVERIRSGEPGGWTALYDALGVYLHGAMRNEGRTILVLLTDGGDTRSRLRIDDVMSAVRASDVTIFAIGFLERETGVAQLRQRLLLTQIAEASGGEAFFPHARRQIDEAFERIGARVRAQYSLGYVSTNAAADGQWRRVEIRLRGDGRSGLRVEARPGYYAPFREPR